MDPKQLKKLKGKWNEKLKSEGLDDIEQKDGNLKQWSSTFYLRFTGDPSLPSRLIQFEERAEYFRRASQFLNEHEFKTDKEKLIWELHSEGFSITETVEKMKTKRFKVTRYLVHTTVKELSKVMRGE